ncbi:MAG: ABC transporter ATP-binding protein [Candidatus Sumerlaeia bacterium]
MLELNNIHVRYGAVRALKGISFEVQKGEIVCILGANGAGKSTILRTISGLVGPESGEILLEKENLVGVAPHKIVEKGVVHCPEGRHIFPECSVLENLEMGAYTLKSRDDLQDNLDKAFEYFPRLAERRKQSGSTLSGGEQQMLGVARALMSNPRLLLLDEPSLGLAPLIVEQIFEIIQRINQEDGMTILLVEQNAREALIVAHRGYVLETGNMILSGKSAELMEDSRIIEAYLGV